MDNKLFVKYVVPKVFSAHLMNMLSERNRLRYEILAKSYDVLNENFEQYKRRVLPNNKLKMMGMPMRRK